MMGFLYAVTCESCRQRLSLKKDCHGQKIIVLDKLRHVACRAVICRSRLAQVVWFSIISRFFHDRFIAWCNGHLPGCTEQCDGVAAGWRCSLTACSILPTHFRLNFAEVHLPHVLKLWRSHNFIITIKSTGGRLFQAEP